MTLIKSISGIRGTLGGKPGEGLTPIDAVKYAAAYGTWVKNRFPSQTVKIVVGRDARISGPLVNRLVTSTLVALGIDVVDCGLSTTPTVEMGVESFQAQGGIIITASHNPKNWNALKLLNEVGEFLSDAQGREVLAIADAEAFEFAVVDKLGKYEKEECLVEYHIEKILALPLVDVEAIRKAGFTVVVDAVNSVGGIAIPMLLDALGVKKVVELFCEPTGHFPHNPEPLPENLGEISELVVKSNAHVGFVVDPDVDRLAIVSEDGEMFGEEFTLVAVADYILQNKKGNTVSNLSSTKALRELTEKAGGQYFASAVGEVNVVAKMKEVNAVIGGEGNGGVIYPELHYGRDALVGIALFLTYLAKTGKSCAALRKKYPDYQISKNKIELSPDVNVARILELMAGKYSKQTIDNTDGVKIHFDSDWVHLRMSNTEPIIRIYAESDSAVKSEHLARKIMTDISEILRDGVK